MFEAEKLHVVWSINIFNVQVGNAKKNTSWVRLGMLMCCQMIGEQVEVTKPDLWWTGNALLLLKCEITHLIICSCKL